jgi:hypothetical protein
MVSEDVNSNMSKDDRLENENEANIVQALRYHLFLVVTTF